MHCNSFGLSYVDCLMTNTTRYFAAGNLNATASTTTEGVVVSNISRISGKVSQMLIEIDFHEFVESFHSWNAGALIQNAFPELDADEREFIKTGITPKEWEAMFGGE